VTSASKGIKPLPTPNVAPIQRVRGTNDFLPPHDARIRRLEARLRAGFELFGYEGVQTPVLEPLELFLRKSGDEVVARMYAFSHWNRRLCLRPELTASVMRAFVNELQGRSLPLRLHYGGAAFRYERPSRGRYRQFTQAGLELIGALGPAADAEVLHLACAALEAVGVRRYRLVVGHLGVVLQMLGQLGMSEHAQDLILDHMEPLARGRLEADAVVARVVDLLGGPADGLAPDAGVSLPAALADLPPEQATAIAADILRRASLPLEGGSRRPRDIIQRLLARANRPDPTEQVREAVHFVLELHAAAGPVERLATLRALVQQYGLSTIPLDEVEAALDLLRVHAQASDEVCWEVDLSLARGLRYYTGLVFEIYVDTPDGPLQVCGGGRYDELIRALGGRESVPACGFGYGLERIDLVREPDPGEQTSVPRVLVVGITPEDHADALALARDLRQSSEFIVEQDVRLRGPKVALRHADRTGVAMVALLGSQEREQGEVVLRNMQSREERRVPRAEVLTALRDALA
jgi:histidyl-tRNA synthetase